MFALSAISDRSAQDDADARAATESELERGDESRAGIPFEAEHHDDNRPSGRAALRAPAHTRAGIRPTLRLAKRIEQKPSDEIDAPTRNQVSIGDGDTTAPNHANSQIVAKRRADASTTMERVRACQDRIDADFGLPPERLLRVESCGEKKRERENEAAHESAVRSPQSGYNPLSAHAVRA